MTRFPRRRTHDESAAHPALGRACAARLAERQRLDEGLRAGRAGYAGVGIQAARVRREPRGRTCRPNCHQSRARHRRRPRRRDTPPPATAAGPRHESGKVHIVTDVLDLDLSLAGGELIRADLLALPAAQGRPVDTGPALQYGLEGHAVRVPVGPDERGGRAKRAEPQGAVHGRRGGIPPGRRRATRSRFRSPGRTARGSR